MKKTATFLFLLFIAGISRAQYEVRKKIIAQDGRNGEYFGDHVAASSDGTTILVVANPERGDELYPGGLYVYKHLGTQTIITKLSDIPSSNTAKSISGIALSPDGNIALVQGINQVNVYMYAGSQWILQNPLPVPFSCVVAQFGASIDFSDDGHSVIIGAPDICSKGRAYIYTLSNNTWILEASLTSSSTSSSDVLFGYDVAISADGKKASVCSPLDDVNGATNQGSVTIFANTNGLWQQQAVLTAPGSENELRFGASTAISAKGDVVVIGQHNPYGDPSSVYVFVNKGDIWRQVQKIVSPVGVAAYSFAQGVGISANAGTIVIAGGTGENMGYLYNFHDSLWTKEQSLLNPSGTSVVRSKPALSSNAGFVLIGASQDSIKKNANQGAAYLFTKKTASLQTAIVSASNSSITLSHIIITPNPTAGIMIIHLTNNNNSQITVSDMGGHKILSKSLKGSQVQLDISNQPSGIYIVEIKQGNNVYRQKVIKQ